MPPPPSLAMPFLRSQARTGLVAEEGAFTLPGNEYLGQCIALGKLYCTPFKRYNYRCSSIKWATSI